MTIRVLQEDGRKAICKLEVLKSDFEVAKQNWALTTSSSMEAQQLAALHLVHVHVAAAAAVASLPESVREAYILLFDAIYGEGSFDKEEEHAWDF